MAGSNGNIAANATLLRGDSIGVSTEINSRLIQQNGGNNGFYCSLNGDWLDQLGLAEKSAETLHSVTVGARPVIVQQPAIIIQPASKVDHIK